MSHLDYQQYHKNIHNDGSEISTSLSKQQQYHTGGGDETIDIENEIGDDDFQGNSLNRGPYFEVSASKNITAIAGQSAYLNCRVRNLGNRTVSIIFL